MCLKCRKIYSYFLRNLVHGLHEFLIFEIYSPNELWCMPHDLKEGLRQY